jgi:RNA polymerase sigma-70 factor (ECF subfamily)
MSFSAQTTFLDAPLPARFDAATGEERRWVVAARSGDSEAILHLLARYRPPLVRLLAGMLGDWAGAEDLAQDSLLHALRSLHQLRSPEGFYPWLRKLAVRRALKSLRHRREVSLEDAGPLTGSPDPAAQVETQVAVWQLLASLPPELRVTLVLREIEGLEYAEIARELEIPIGTVRSRLFAARERFRALWSES